MAVSYDGVNRTKTISLIKKAMVKPSVGQTYLQQLFQRKKAKCDIFWPDFFSIVVFDYKPSIYSILQKLFSKQSELSAHSGALCKSISNLVLDKMKMAALRLPQYLIQKMIHYLKFSLFVEELCQL